MIKIHPTAILDLVLIYLDIKAVATVLYTATAASSVKLRVCLLILETIIIKLIGRKAIVNSMYLEVLENYPELQIHYSQVRLVKNGVLGTSAKCYLLLPVRCLYSSDCRRTVSFKD